MLRSLNFGIFNTRNANVNSAHKKAGAVGSTPAFRLLPFLLSTHRITRLYEQGAVVDRIGQEV